MAARVAVKWRRVALHVKQGEPAKALEDEGPAIMNRNFLRALGGLGCLLALSAHASDPPLPPSSFTFDITSNGVQQCAATSARRPTVTAPSARARRTRAAA